MGWWKTEDGTVIGDELADIAGVHLEKMEEEMLRKYPNLTGAQIRHTMAFCGNVIPRLGDKDDGSRLEVEWEETCNPTGGQE